MTDPISKEKPMITKYTKEEIEFMQSLGLNFNFNDLTDDDWCDIIDTVGDKLVQSGLDEKYNPNSIGRMCETIMDKVPKD